METTGECSLRCGMRNHWNYYTVSSIGRISTRIALSWSCSRYQSIIISYHSPVSSSRIIIISYHHPVSSSRIIIHFIHPPRIMISYYSPVSSYRIRLCDMSQWCIGRLDIQVYPWNESSIPDLRLPDTAPPYLIIVYTGPVRVPLHSRTGPAGVSVKLISRIILYRLPV